MQPWSGVAEAILKPLPADWRHNIQNAFSQLGDALGKLLGAGEGQKVGLICQALQSSSRLPGCLGLRCGYGAVGCRAALSLPGAGVVR